MAPKAKLPAPLVGDNNAEPLVATEAAPVQPAQPGFVPLVENLSSEKEMDILRFKSDVQPVKRNTAWKRGAVEIEEIEHRHYWDSHSRSGSPNKYCVAKNGHTHAVSYELSPDGKGIKTVCGPALRESSQRKLSGTAQRTYDRIFLHMTNDEVNGGTKPVYDDHTHVISYMKTEKILVRAN